MELTIEDIKSSVHYIWLKKTVKSIMIFSIIFSMLIIGLAIALTLIEKNLAYLFLLFLIIFILPYFYAGIYNFKKMKYLIKNYSNMAQYKIKLTNPEKAYNYRGKSHFLFVISHKGEELSLDTPAMWSLKNKTGFENSNTLMLYDEFYKEAFLIKKL